MPIKGGGRGTLVRNLFKAAAAKRAAAKRAAEEAEAAKRAAEAEAEAAKIAAEAAEAKRAAEQAATTAKLAILKLKKNLQEQKDVCIANYNITECKNLQYSDAEDTDSIPSKRIRRINALLKQSLSTLVNQDNKLNSSVNETKNNKLEELFKKLLYSFIEELINNIYNNPTDINTYVDNIKHTTITDQNYNNKVMLVKKYINSYYSKGIAILNDKDDVKYYKLTEDKYKEYDYSIKDGKLNNFFILRIIDKKIMIHQIYQQIIYALIDTITKDDITKDDVIFNKYYNLIKVR